MIGESATVHPDITKSERDKIKCVISGTDAPATSHEATTFRSEGKPVLYTARVSEGRQLYLAKILS